MVQYVCSVVYNHHSAVHGVFGIEKVVSEAYLPLRHKYRIVAWGTISKSFLTHSAPGTCNMHFSSHSSSTARQFSTSLIGQVARATLSDHRRRKKSRKNLPLFSQACTCRPAHTTYVRYSILFKWSHERKEQTNCFHEVRLTTWSWKVPIYPSPRYWNTSMGRPSASGQFRVKRAFIEQWLISAEGYTCAITHDEWNVLMEEIRSIWPQGRSWMPNPPRR